MRAFLLSIYKNRGAFIHAFRSSFCGSRLFYGVLFRNPGNIAISPQSNIESGSWILVSDPTNPDFKNIIVEDHCWIGRNVEIQTNFDSRIEIKEFASVQDRCKLLGNVSIGKYAILAPDIFMSSGNHDYKSDPYLTIREQDNANDGVAGFKRMDRPIVIEEDCWIGKNVFIKQGIYIGRGAIVGTNSIVSNDLAPYSISAGTPAQKIKDRVVFNPPLEISAFTVEHRPYFYRGFEHFSRSKSTAELVQENQGIACEQNTLALLEKSDWQTIALSGFSKTATELKVYADGLLYSTSQIPASETFEISITAGKSGHVLLAEYAALPELIKKYRCIQVVLGSGYKKYDLAISKITAL